MSQRLSLPFVRPIQLHVACTQQVLISQRLFLPCVRLIQLQVDGTLQLLISQRLHLPCVLPIQLPCMLIMILTPTAQPKALCQSARML